MIEDLQRLLFENFVLSLKDKVSEEKVWRRTEWEDDQNIWRDKFSKVSPIFFKNERASFDTATANHINPLF